MIIILTVFSLLIILWMIEYLLSDHRLDQIPIRILVTGTRGKTSITRLIAAGLSAGNIPAIAKTTGSATSIVTPTGKELPLTRSGIVSILEQKKCAVIARKYHAKAMVVESMALRPQLLWTESHRLIKPHVVVISNVGPDHLDVTGANEKAIAQAFTQTMRPGSDVFTWHHEYADVFEKKTELTGCGFYIINDTDYNGFDFSAMSYHEHSENIKLALAVCNHLGVNPETAFSGMLKVTPDIGVLREIKVKMNDRSVTFVNAFAANDPDATLKIFEKYNEPEQNAERWIIVNLRNDRPHRTLQICDLILSGIITADKFIFTGDDLNTTILKRIKKNAGADNLVVLNSSDKIMDYLESNIINNTLITGVGNIARVGMSLVRKFMALAELEN